MKAPVCILAAALFLGGGTAAGAAPSQVTIQNTIADLVALGNTSSSYPAVQVLGYNAAGDGGGGLFSWNASSTAAQDSCTVFQAAGVATGRWIRQLGVTPLDVRMCGAYGDNRHDDATAFNNAGIAAQGLMSHTVHIGAGHYKIGSTITAQPTVIYQGAGMSAVPSGYGSTAPTIIDASAARRALWVFDLELPNGTGVIQAPQFRDMSIIAPFKYTSTGGCIRLNNPANGFSDDAKSQQYMSGAVVYHLYCEMQNVANNAQVGIQCSKCFRSDFSGLFIQYGGNGIRLEGSDQITVGAKESVTLAGQSSYLLVNQAHGTFGNTDTFQNIFLSSPACYHQNLLGFVLLAGRGDVLENSYAEGGACAGAQSIVYIPGGFSHSIQRNNWGVDSAVTYSVHVTDTTLVHLDVRDNFTAAGMMRPAHFDGGSQYYYNSAIRQRICHGGNADRGDDGFSMNCVASSLDSIPFGPKVVRLFSCGSDGLNYEQDGTTVTCQNGGFYLTNGGSRTTHNLRFGNTSQPVVACMCDLWVYAKSDGAGGSLDGYVTDNGSNVGAGGTVSLTTGYQWYRIQSGATASTAVGAAVHKNWASRSNVSVKFVALAQH